MSYQSSVKKCNEMLALVKAGQPYGGAVKGSTKSRSGAPLNFNNRRSRKELIMEHRSAITLKSGDVISIPGIGTKVVGAINQIRHDRYQIRLDEKFTESVDVDIVITNGEHRSPERHDGPWSPKS